MSYRLNRIGVVLAGLLTISISAHAGERQSLPTTEELTGGVLGWIAELREEKPLFAFRRIADIEKLDARGKVKKKERKIYRSVVINGSNFDRLVSVDGQEPDEEEREEDLDRMEDFRERQSEHRASGERFFDADLVERFIFEVKGTQEIRGRNAYVVRFRPDRSKDLPETDDKDVLANALAGTMWIDAEDFALARLDAHLIRPIRIGWGLLADIQKVNLRISMQRTDEGDWFPRVANIYVWGRTLLFKPIRSRQVHRFVDVERIR